METIRGFVNYIFYPKDGLKKDGGIQYTGMSIEIQNPKKKMIKCFGNVPYVTVGEYLEFHGEYQEDGIFKFTGANRVDDDEIGAKSMMIFIFGPKTADKLIHHFDDDAMKCWNVFKEHPDMFETEGVSIKGISAKKIAKAYEKYENNITVDVLFNKFSKYGLMFTKALAIYSEWGTKAMDRINENPYSMIFLDKIPFEIIDKIALGYYKIDKTDERRIYAGVLNVMKSINMQGHTFIRLDKTIHDNESSLLEEASRILKVDKSLIREEIFNLVDDKKLVMNKFGFTDVVYLPYMFQAEKGVATILKDMISANVLEDAVLNEFIEEYEEQHNFKMADKQIEAVKTACKNRFSIISGPPGSGKTTIIDCICSILNTLIDNCNIKLAAPTGKAAKRMTESTGMKAETIHRMLRYSPQEQAFTHNQANPLDANVIIVDEFSMMSTVLTYQLLLAIPKDCMVIFVGDKNQLPSVDAGKVLEDLLAVKFIPKVILNKIYRQGNDSTILTRALDISHDRVPILTDTNDFTFWEETDIDALKDGLLNLYYDECKKYGMDNVLLLSPMNVRELGVDALNEEIQEHCNPYTGFELKSGKRKFRKNDRVIQLVNEDNFEVYNGMVGTIIDIIKEDKKMGIKDTIIVDYGDMKCEYTRDRFDNIKLAYCMTIHKCQGSEAKSVIMICHGSQRFMLRKKLIYTGMTRAKTHLHIVGDKNMIDFALTNKEPIRNSQLKKFLEN